MTCTNTGSLPCTPAGLSFNSANNRIAADGIHIYDNGMSGGPGNLTADGTHGYVYDLENRVTCVLGTDGTCTSATATLYFYDPQGRRVGKQQGDTIEDYVYDPQGNITSVHDGGANLLRAELYTPQGRHVATWNSSYVSNPGLYWNHADWLGTERVRTNSSHQIAQTCTDTPYGMNASCVSPQADLSAMHFTGLQYDYETGQFHALNRQYPATLGRWLTADPSGKGAVHLDYPQSWNFYAYVANNPTTLTDPSGLGFWEWLQTHTKPAFDALHTSDSGHPTYQTRSGTEDTRQDSVSKRLLNSLYLKHASGAGYGFTFKAAVGKISIGEKEVTEVKHTAEGDTVSKEKQIGGTIELGPLKVGLGQRTTQVTEIDGISVNRPAQTDTTMLLEGGELKGENAEVGFGIGGYAFGGAEISVGVQADQALRALKDAAKEALNAGSDLVQTTLSD